jgi:hypothetical protein
MKYFASFALLTLAVFVVINAEDHTTDDPCGVLPDAATICGPSEPCYTCLAGECYTFALNNDCEGLKDCVQTSTCA